jgi:hypothetical protein
MSFESARDMESSGVQIQLPVESACLCLRSSRLLLACCATDGLFQGRWTLSKVAEILGSLTSRGDFLAFTSVLQEMHGNASLCACCAPLPTGAFDITEQM